MSTKVGVNLEITVASEEKVVDIVGSGWGLLGGKRNGRFR